MWEIPVDGWMTVPVCGTQFSGSLAANQTQRWFTFNWPATWHMVWTVMPTTPGTAAQITLTVQVQRASAEFVTYWLTVQNLTASPVNFEGRYLHSQPLLMGGDDDNRCAIYRHPDP